jgi:Na+-transporting methylmalonyl-CoA/oxaloacetate decarboxylase gamma subunit
MYLVVIAWAYVVLMVAVAEAASSSNGSLLGAGLTFVMWGVLPLAIVTYLMGTPARRRARKSAEAAEAAEAAAGSAAPVLVTRGHTPDRSDHAAGDTIAPEREKP